VTILSITKFFNCYCGCVRRRGELLQMVRLLLKRGADPTVSSVPLPPLLIAVRSGDVDIVKMLLLAGADPNVTLPPSVCTLTTKKMLKPRPSLTGTIFTTFGCSHASSSLPNDSVVYAISAWLIYVSALSGVI